MLNCTNKIGKGTESSVINTHSSKIAIICMLVSQKYNVKISDLLARSRLNANIALSRQIAMYLAHVMGEINLTRAAKAFGRDRTTVAHACHLIEDKRDDPVFDEELSILEEKFLFYSSSEEEENIPIKDHFWYPESFRKDLFNNFYKKLAS